MHLHELISTIKARRKTLGINQEELSDLTDIGLRTIKGLESGKTNPTLKTITTILNTLGLELSIQTKK